MKLIDIARACHEANAGLCLAHGDASQPTWWNAPDWARDSALNGVALHVLDPHLPPSASHEAWLAQKNAEGWKFGEVKDPEAKTHPCFRPYAELPTKDQAKDHVFKAIVNALSDHLEPEERALAADMVQAWQAKVNTTAAQQPAEEVAKPAAEA